VKSKLVLAKADFVSGNYIARIVSSYGIENHRFIVAD
jgi:hypothetical protein